MTVHVTESMMTSDITPEAALREAGVTEATWQLTWLPGRLLTREQALAGMELDEILSDPGMVHDRRAHAEVALRADTLGIVWEHAVILLSKRMVARLRRHRREPDSGSSAAGEPALSGRIFHTHRPSLHAGGPS